MAAPFQQELALAGSDTGIAYTNPLRSNRPGVVFATPEEGVAPGQACVLYAPEADTRVLGGGFIDGTVRNA